MTTRAPEKIRDPVRSRDAIMAAAELLFAERGYGGASLNDIAAEAGLSRGTPSYFFGSKEQLYAEVIDRVFAIREAATRAAFEPVHAWCEGDGGVDELRSALRAAAEDYMAFLAGSPAFVKLILREELAGAAGIRGRKGKSTAMEDAFGAVAAQRGRAGLRSFAVEDAVLLFVALTFMPMSFSNTLMRAVRRDLRRPAARKEQVGLAVAQMMHLLAG